MTRFLIPILLIIGAGGVFYFLTDPIINNQRTFDDATQKVGGGIKSLLAEKESLNKAIADIQSLKGRAQDLEATYQKIDPEQIKKLDVFLPDAVDDIQLIVDVNTIAQKSGMQLKDVKINTDLDKTGRTASRVDATANTSPLVNKPAITKVGLSFAVIGTYSQMRAFMGDLTRSLRVLDVTRLSFSAQPATGAAATSTQLLAGGQYQYQVDLVTYWLK
ncbi:MAG: hypothetical protein K8Q91_02935 [Candidatus Vogelbacteria bacterium]|nr:hypothetical protein [Candidatus Vogelbacteria bacterium]